MKYLLLLMILTLSSLAGIAATPCNISKISTIQNCQMILDECDLYANSLYVSRKISGEARTAYHDFFSHFEHDLITESTCSVANGSGTCTDRFDTGCTVANWPTQGYDLWEKAKKDLAAEVDALLSENHAPPFDHYRGYLCENYHCDTIQNSQCIRFRPSLLSAYCKRV